MYSCKILKDSSSPTGARITTFEVTFPRIVLAEFNTHRVFSRNSASSRAIPVEKMIERVRTDPFIPIYWGKKQKGMQAEEELSLADVEEAKAEWLKARDNAILQAERLLSLGLHKQITNRLLEPWLWHTCIVTSTEWDNFFALRCDKNAQPEIQRIAQSMRDAHVSGKPQIIQTDEWHLPLVYEEGAELEALVSKFGIDGVARISCGRCARVSYLTHDGRRDPEADLTLAEGLAKNGHMSPFEHAATPIVNHVWQGGLIYRKPSIGETTEPQERLWSGNHQGWIPYRSMMQGEAVWKPA
jgi:thymidylate synthase ThyX